MTNKNIKQLCPQCGNTSILLVQTVAEEWSINAIHADGSLDLGVLVDTYMASGYRHLMCTKCHTRLGVDVERQSLRC